MPAEVLQLLENWQDSPRDPWDAPLTPEEDALYDDDFYSDLCADLQERAD